MAEQTTSSLAFATNPTPAAANRKPSQEAQLTIAFILILTLVYLSLKFRHFITKLPQ